MNPHPPSTIIAAVGALATIAVITGAVGPGIPIADNADPAANTTTTTAVANTTTTSDTTTTAAPTTTEFDMELDATPEDARILDNRTSFAAANTREIAGGLSMMWHTPSPDVGVPPADRDLTNTSDANLTLGFIIMKYSYLAHNDTIEGGLTVTAVHDGQRVAVWHVEEDWGDRVYADEMPVSEFFGRIRETRTDFTDTPDAGGDSP